MARYVAVCAKANLHLDDESSAALQYESQNACHHLAKAQVSLRRVTTAEFQTMSDKEIEDGVRRNLRVAETLIKQAADQVEKTSPALDGSQQPACDTQILTAIQSHLERLVRSCWPAPPRFANGDSGQAARQSEAGMDRAFEEWQEERRKEERVPLALEATFKGESGLVQASTGNISAEGCYVSAPETGAIGEQTTLLLRMPAGRWIQLQAEVIYKQPGRGLGLHFVYGTELERSLFSLSLQYAWDIQTRLPQI